MTNKERVSIYNREYRLKNKEKIKSLQDAYYESHRLDRIRNAQNWTRNNKDKALKTRRAYMNTLPGRLTSIKGSAKTRGIEYSLEDNEALSIMQNPCHYCGFSGLVSIDRVQNGLGYLHGNCVACCTMCNLMKRHHPLDSFIEHCRKIVKHTELYLVKE